MSVGEKGFEAEVPVAEEIRAGVVWNPVSGVSGEPMAVLGDARVEALVVEEIERRLAEPHAWREPRRAKVDDQRDRLVMTGTGAFMVARKNHWGKWVAVGVGVVDPVCYAEIARPEPGDLKWVSK